MSGERRQISRHKWQSISCGRKTNETWKVFFCFLFLTSSFSLSFTLLSNFRAVSLFSRLSKPLARWLWTWFTRLSQFDIVSLLTESVFDCYRTTRLREERRKVCDSIKRAPLISHLNKCCLKQWCRVSSDWNFSSLLRAWCENHVSIHFVIFTFDAAN